MDLTRGRLNKLESGLARTGAASGAYICNKTKIKLKHKTVVLTSATKLKQNVKLF
jgi:hypothetical protein